MIKLLIYKYRVERRLSLRELEKLSGVSKSALNNFENNKRSPTLSNLESISKALNVKVKDLFLEE